MEYPRFEIFLTYCITIVVSIYFFSNTSCAVFASQPNAVSFSTVSFPLLIASRISKIDSQPSVQPELCPSFLQHWDIQTKSYLLCPSFLQRWDIYRKSHLLCPPLHQHRDIQTKNHLRCPISTVLWDIQNNFFYICPNYIKKKDIIKNFFCICPSTTPHCPSFYLTVSCLTTSSNRFVRCLISSCETP